MQNNPANYTDPSGHIRSPHLMLDDRFGGKVYNRPRPMINPDDGTLYAPSTPEHKAHQIRQQQTGNYSYVYTPKVYSNTPIIKPTSYAQAQAQRDRAREQALAEQRRKQNIRNEYSRATGSKGKAKTREAQNLFKNWGAALSSMYTHVCKTAKRWVDSGVKFLKNVDWKKVGVTVGAIGVGIALTVATGGLGAPAAMAIGGAATGAIISGYDGYTSGKRGWELVGAIGQGAGVGALTGFVGGHLMGAGAGIATSATQNIRNQAVRHVVKAGIEAGVETAVDTGISVATGSPVTLKNVVTDYGLNLVTNGSGSISKTSATKPIKVGGVEVYDANYKYTRPIKDVTPVNNQKLLTGPDPNALRLEAPKQKLALPMPNDIVTIQVSKRKYPQSAQHIQDARASGQPSILTIDRTSAKTNRSQSLKGIDKVPGKDLDEYPPAMFSEGGAGASVRAIEQSDNRGSGSSMGHQLRPFDNGTKVYIDIVD